MKIFVLLFACCIVSHCVSTVQWPYLQIYPPVNSSDDRTPLYIAVVLSTSGHFPTIRVLPGIQIALDYINNEPSLLPGYSLHYTLIGTKCKTFGAVNSFFRQVLTEPTKLAWIGSGCSVATESTAELTPLYNLTQVSCASGLTENEMLYQKFSRYYFQALPITDVVAYGYLRLILHFKWNKVSIITQNQGIYVNIVNILKKGLNFYNIQFSEIIFTDVADIGETAYDSGARIYILATDARQSRELTCEAYKRGLRYPKYQFLLPGWFPEGYLQDFSSIKLDCNEEERIRTLEYALTVSILDFDDTSNETGIGGYNFADFRRKVETKYRDPLNSHLNLSNATSASPELCYEATLSVALALHDTMMDLESNISLRHTAGSEANLPEVEEFTLDDFSYSNFVIVERMFHHLSSTDFIGINARRVNFNEKGRRVSRTLQIGQYLNRGGVVTHLDVGVVKNASIEGSYLQILPTDRLWPNGTPTDGLPIINIITVSISNIVVFSILGVIGILYSLAYIIFNYIHRNKKIIRLSSPNLNYIIGVGAILLYSTLFLLIVRGAEGTLRIIVSFSSTWLISLGYTLFFGSITSKMIRVWYIFNNPSPRKKLTVTDYHLIGIVSIFVASDILILGGFTLIEGARGNLKLSRAMSAEQPQRLIGPTAEVHQYFFYTTFSQSVLVWYAVIGIEKLVLGIMSLVFAIRTRKVKMRGLDDSKFVIAATYATNLFSLPGIAGTLGSIGGYYNVFVAVLGGNLFVSTTTVLSLIFIPKIVALYKDPSGEDVGGIIILSHKPVPLVIEPTNNRETEKIALQKLIKTLETRLAKYVGDNAAV